MSSADKTLIILSPGFPANEADTTCLPFPQLFVKTLKRLHPSLNIIVIAFQYPFHQSEYLWHGVKVIAFNGRNKGKINRLILWNSIRKRIDAIMKEQSVAGILSFWLGECALMAKYAARKYKLSSFTWLLGQDARKNNRYFFLVKPKAGHLIALSDFIAAEFNRNYGLKPANIIMPGIDTGEFSAVMPVRDIDIVGVGSLIPLKRFDIFIRVVAELARIKPAIKTIICGKGGEREKLEAMISHNGLSANISLCGELDHAQVLILMQRSKILLHPSEYEGFSTVLSEALYAGAHVVCCCNPMAQTFSHQHIAETESEMFDKVKELLEDVALCHEKIITSSIEITCQRIIQLYQL